MLRIDKRCPWCGRDISAPKRFHGVCEHCGKQYRPIVLLYNRTRTKRSETAVWVWYGMGLAVSVLLLKSLTVFYRVRHGTSLFSVLLLVILAAAVLFGKKQAYLKRIDIQEDPVEDRLALIRRRVCLLEHFPSPLYHSPFDMEVLDPETGTAYPRHGIQIDLDEDLKPVMETGPDAPDYMLRPGMAFRLYKKDGEMLTEGITSTLCSEPLQIFQTQLSLAAESGILDKKLYYVAYMHLDEGDIPFYLVPDAHDLLGDMKTGKTVYEVQLIHRSYRLPGLPVPVSFELLNADGTWLGSGRVTYYFDSRGHFEEKSL